MTVGELSLYFLLLGKGGEGNIDKADIFNLILCEKQVDIFFNISYKLLTYFVVMTVFNYFFLRTPACRCFWKFASFSPPPPSSTPTLHSLFLYSRWKEIIKFQKFKIMLMLLGTSQIVHIINTQ